MRLTLFLHPGRIKRGVGPNETLGPPLRVGEQYRLVVAGSLESARGEPLSEDFVKSFGVGAPDRASPDRDALGLRPPLDSRGALRLELPEPLDRGQLRRLVVVHDDRGQPVPGRVEILRGETLWEFTPSSPWGLGEYTVWIPATLEDRAGNTLLHRSWGCDGDRFA